MAEKLSARSALTSPTLADFFHVVSAGASFKMTFTTLATLFQQLSANLSALAGLTSAANKLPYFTGSGTASLADLSSFGRSLIDDADASTARGTLGVVIGTNVQAQNTNLSALAGLTSAADKIAYFTGSGTAALLDISSYGQVLLGQLNDISARSYLGLGSAAIKSDSDFFQISNHLSETLGAVLFADLPASPYTGQRATISDFDTVNFSYVFNDNVTSGGGAGICPVFFNGSNWRQG